MTMRWVFVAVLVAGAGAARADVVLLTQQRSITAATSADGGSQTVAAPDFSHFVQTVSLSTTFQGAGGPQTNASVARIDCQVDPNRIVANGTLSGAGGVAVGGTTEIGDSRAAVLVTFRVLVPTAFTFAADPRPDLHPTDEFVLDFRNTSTNTHIVDLDNTVPPQAVSLSGILQPGDYSFRYRIECTLDESFTARDYSFDLAVPAPAGCALLGLAGLVATRRRR